MNFRYFFFLLFSFCCFAQKNHYKVVYEQKKLATEFGVSIPSTVKTYLEGDGKNSIYIEDWTHVNNEETNNIFSIKSEKNPAFFKDLNNKTIIYSTHIRLKPFDLKDEIAGFNWNIKSETKNILGYNCQKATTVHRGRTFTVYFAQEIPFADGPWKLFGLPGLILDVKLESSLGSLTISAVNVEIKENSNEIVNPFVDKKIIGYDEFVKIYNKKNEEMLSQQAEGSTLRLSDGFMEILLKK